MAKLLSSKPLLPISRLWHTLLGLKHLPSYFIIWQIPHPLKPQLTLLLFLKASLGFPHLGSHNPWLLFVIKLITLICMNLVNISDSLTQLGSVWGQKLSLICPHMASCRCLIVVCWMNILEMCTLSQCILDWITTQESSGRCRCQWKWIGLG